MLLVHKHLIVRAEVLNAPKDENLIKTWFSELVDKIGMKIMMGPFAQYCNVKGNRGLTCVGIIETSHIALHTWDEVNPNLLQLDVYSCGEFNVSDIVDHISAFDPVKVEYKFIDRENNLTTLDQDIIRMVPNQDFSGQLDLNLSGSLALAMDLQ
jgi:hypothetical protein